MSESVTNPQMIYHHRNMVSSYNQHKLTEQLLWEEEQMAHEQDFIMQQNQAVYAQLLLQQ